MFDVNVMENERSIYAKLIHCIRVLVCVCVWGGGGE